MEFQFDINEYFKQPIVEIKNTLLPPDFAGDRRALWNTVNRVAEVVNEMGEASAHAQGLTKPITTADRLRQSDQTLYFLVDRNANSGYGSVTGMLKVGKKGLYVFDKEGQHYKVSPPCVLDFYVHEKHQRNGLGKQLFEHMLKKEDVKPHHLAIDRPSDKFLNFLNKHYSLASPIKQMNNYVVFDQFFEPAGREGEKEVNQSPSLRSNGLQGALPNYGRYGAPRPPCSMGQIIHNTTPVYQKGREQTSNNEVDKPPQSMQQYSQNHEKRHFEITNGNNPTINYQQPMSQTLPVSLQQNYLQPPTPYPNNQYQYVHNQTSMVPKMNQITPGNHPAFVQNMNERNQMINQVPYETTQNQFPANMPTSGQTKNQTGQLWETQRQPQQVYYMNENQNYVNSNHQSLPNIPQEPQSYLNLQHKQLDNRVSQNPILNEQNQQEVQQQIFANSNQNNILPIQQIAPHNQQLVYQPPPSSQYVQTTQLQQLPGPNPISYNYQQQLPSPVNYQNVSPMQYQQPHISQYQASVMPQFQTPNGLMYNQNQQMFTPYNQYNQPMLPHQYQQVHPMQQQPLTVQQNYLESTTTPVSEVEKLAPKQEQSPSRTNETEYQNILSEQTAPETHRNEQKESVSSLLQVDPRYFKPNQVSLREPMMTPLYPQTGYKLRTSRPQIETVRQTPTGKPLGMPNGKSETVASLFKAEAEIFNDDGTLKSPSRENQESKREIPDTDNYRYPSRLQMQETSPSSGEKHKQHALTKTDHKNHKYKDQLDWQQNQNLIPTAQSPPEDSKPYQEPTSKPTEIQAYVTTGQVMNSNQGTKFENKNAGLAGPPRVSRFPTTINQDLQIPQETDVHAEGPEMISVNNSPIKNDKKTGSTPRVVTAKKPVVITPYGLNEGDAKKKPHAFKRVMKSNQSEIDDLKYGYPPQIPKSSSDNPKPKTILRGH